MRNDIIYPELSYRITGLLMMAQRELGRFCREKQYADLLENLFKKEKINYEREKSVDFKIANNLIRGNRVDFIIENKILLELKSESFLTKHDYYQTMRYLRAANLKLGLLANMRSEYLKPKRILNSSHHSH